MKIENIIIAIFFTLIQGLMLASIALNGNSLASDCIMVVDLAFTYSIILSATETHSENKLLKKEEI